MNTSPLSLLEPGCRVVRLRIRSILLLAVAGAVLSQSARAQHYAAMVEPDSPEGQFLELIELQSAPSKKLALMEQFTERYPKHKAASWALEQLQEVAFKAGNWDGALRFGEKLSQLNPDDMETAQMNKRAAEAKGDRVTVRL